MFESYESSDNARFIIIDAFNLGSRLNFMKAKEETVYPVMTFKPINKALSLGIYYTRYHDKHRTRNYHSLSALAGLQIIIFGLLKCAQG